MSWVAAQDRYVVSARAGTVNVISGQAFVTRAGGVQSALLRQDTIDAGDVASTGDGSYAEILLDPGSYMRLAPNSRFRFTSTSLEDTSVALEAGSAIFEINADNAFALTVTTPTATLRLDRSGIYRVDLEPAPGVVEVIKGKLLVGSTEVKSGRLLALAPGATTQKFDPKAMDTFAEWSDSRARELARITDAVETEALNRSLNNSYYLNAWDFSSAFGGMWIWDRSFGSGFFLPYGYGGRTHWSCNYYHSRPFNWDHHGWTDRWHHPRVTNTGSNNTFAGSRDRHPKPVDPLATRPTERPTGTDRHREPRTENNSSRDSRPRSTGANGPRGSSDPGRSRGGSSGAGGGSRSGGGDSSHRTWAPSGGSRSSGGSSGGGGGSRSSGGSSGGGGGGSRSSGSSGSSGGGGGSHSGGGSGSHSSGGSGGRSSPAPAPAPTQPSKSRD